MIVTKDLLREREFVATQMCLHDTVIIKVAKDLPGMQLCCCVVPTTIGAWLRLSITNMAVITLARMYFPLFKIHISMGLHVL